MDTIAHRYAAFLGRVDAILDSNYGMETWDIAYGWYAAFIAGMEPGTAVEAAIAELRGLGLLDATVAPHIFGRECLKGAK